MKCLNDLFKRINWRVLFLSVWTVICFTSAFVVAESQKVLAVLIGLSGLLSLLCVAGLLVNEHMI